VATTASHPGPTIVVGLSCERDVVTWQKQGGSTMKKDPSETPEGAMEKLPVLSLSNIWTLARAMKYEPRVRMDKIQEVRARIAEGHYDDPEKVDATVDAILNDIELIEMARSKAIEIRQDREAAQRQREKRVVLTAGPSV
jgi:hypothetical protein